MTFKNTNIYENSVYNFCRLTGLKRSEYDHLIFESGCRYAEKYSQTIFPSVWKEISYEMTQLPLFWEWWKKIWNMRIQEAFRISGIPENSTFIHTADASFLLQAFYNHQNQGTFFSIRPDLLLLKALKEKIYENEKLCRHLPFIHRGSARKRTRKKNKFAEPGNLPM